MVKQSLLKTLAAIGMIAGAVGSANAAMIQWNFHGNGSGNNSDAGNVTVASMKTYSDQSVCGAGPLNGPVACGAGGMTIDAVGLTNTFDGFTAIIENNRPGVEDGLGVQGGVPSTPEIGLNQAIRLDLFGLALVDWEILFNSVDGTGANEEFVEVWSSNLTNSLGVQILDLGASTPGINTMYQSINPVGRYLYILADGGSSADVLLKSIRGSTVVPEPTTFALLGVGLLGFGFAKRRATRHA